MSFARAISQNGLTMNQVWLNGYDRTTLQQYASIMKDVYFGLSTCPLRRLHVPGVYPAWRATSGEMQKYQPSFTYDEVALDGWISADLFVPA